MNGTLRATRVPYDEDDPQYEEAVDTLNEYAGSYPVSGELRVRRELHTGVDRYLVRHSFDCRVLPQLRNDRNQHRYTPPSIYQVYIYSFRRTPTIAGD